MRSVVHAQGHLEQVTSICSDREHEHVVVGDSAGHLRVWDVRGGVDVSSPEACQASFRPVRAPEPSLLVLCSKGRRNR